MWSFKKQAYHRPWRVTVMYWLPYSWLSWISLILMSTIVVVILSGITWLLATQLGLLNSATILPSSIDPNARIGILAALVGAMIGSVIAGVISVSLQTQQYSSDSMIKKKAEIYEPLYDALRKFREDLGNKYPYSYITEPSKHSDRYVSYVLWTKFRRESKYLHIPTWLQHSLDHHLLELTGYHTIRNEARDCAYQEVQKVLSQEFQRPFGMKPDSYGYDDISETMIGELILADTQNANRYFRRDVLDTLGEEESSAMFLYTSKKCMKLPEVHALVKHQSDIIAHTDWLIKELELLIQFINRRYEAQGNLL